MNQDLKEKWCAALRSGNYRQGHSFLKNQDGEFCCLGVLCDVVGCTWENNNDVNIPFLNGVGFSDGGGFLNGHATEFVDLPPQKQFRLSDLNDAGQSFDQIANIIEAEL